MPDEGFVPVPQDPARERRELAERLRMLRQATGKSQRELAEVLGVDHSTVSVYEKPDGRVPDLEYIDGFLAEVAGRTDITAVVLKDTRGSYGRLLRLLCDQPQERGRTHNYRQMLRVYELTLEREVLTAELAEVREQQQDVEDELNRLQQEVVAGAPVDRERQQRLEESAAALGQRRAVLARRRDTVVSDLDAYHAQLRQLQIPPRPTAPPAGALIGGAPQQLSLDPALPRRNTGPQPLTTAIVAGAVVSALLGGWLIYRMTNSGDDSADLQLPSDPPVAEVSPSPTPSTTQTTSQPKPTKPESTLLSDLRPVAVEGDNLGQRYLRVGEGTLDNTHYTNALVSDLEGPYSGLLGCSRAFGYSEYNLSRDWKKLTMVLGIDDNSAEQAAKITMTLDGKTIYKKEVSLGKAQRLDLDVTDGLRLRISFDDGDPEDHECHMGNVVIGDPTLFSN